MSRDEIKFTKYITRLRKKFIHLFSDTLKTHILKGFIVSEDDWYNISLFIKYDFIQDAFTFSEMKEQEIEMTWYYNHSNPQDFVPESNEFGEVFSMVLCS